MKNRNQRIDFNVKYIQKAKYDKTKQYQNAPQKRKIYMNKLMLKYSS